MSRCECCPLVADHVCARDDMPALYFCADHFREHSCGAHPHEQYQPPRPRDEFEQSRYVELFWILCRQCGANDTLILKDGDTFRLHCAHCAVYELL